MSATGWSQIDSALLFCCKTTRASRNIQFLSSFTVKRETQALVSSWYGFVMAVTHCMYATDEYSTQAYQSLQVRIRVSWVVACTHSV
jgi:hypothetical protein